MALDGIFLNMTLAEIRSVAVGARVDKVHQPSKTELVFSLRTRSGGFKLFCGANPGSPRINITESQYDNPKSPPMLCMLLRKKLCGSTITAVRQHGLDRVVYIDFSGTDDIGDPEDLTLIVEIMAQHSNIILINSVGKIVDAVRRIDSDPDAYRRVMPGEIYKLPPEQNKLDIITATDSQIRSALLLYPSVVLSSAVLRSVAGVSPLTSREVAFRATGDDKTVGELTVQELSRAVEQVADLRDVLINEIKEPVLIFSEDGRPFEFSFRDVTQYGSSYEKLRYSSLCELLDAFYSERDRFLRMKARSSSLYKQVDNLVERTVRKLSVREEELKSSADMDKLRIYAELITANQYTLGKGEICYELVNYYDENKTVRIPVDPALSATANAQKYYKDYRRAKNASQLLVGLIEESREELLYFESVQDALSRAAGEDEISLIRSELAQQGYLRSESVKGKGIKITSPEKLPPHRYISSDGFEIIAGRSNLQNEKLSLKIAEKTDWWFHVTKAPGSHVILCTRGEAPTDTAVLQAAAVALKHSSLSGMAKASIDYTEVKNLKKPAGAKPGHVIYNTYFSMIVSGIETPMPEEYGR